MLCTVLHAESHFIIQVHYFVACECAQVHDVKLMPLNILNFYQVPLHMLVQHYISRWLLCRFQQFKPYQEG